MDPPTHGINRAKSGLWGYDVTTGQLGCSERARHILGIAPGVEINLQLLRSICHPDDVASVSKFVESALVDTKPLNVEFRIVRSDGEIRWVFLSARGQFNDSGQLLL